MLSVMFELAKPDFLLSAFRHDVAAQLMNRLYFLSEILRGSVGVALSALHPACLQTLAALTDSPPQPPQVGGCPPTAGRRRLHQAPSGSVFFPYSWGGGWGVGGCRVHPSVVRG